MRAIDPFTGPRVWAEAKPALKRLLCKASNIPEACADVPFEQLDHGRIATLAAAAARLAWAAQELEAMAPLVPDRTGKPAKKPSAPLPTIQPELVAS